MEFFACKIISARRARRIFLLPSAVEIHNRQRLLGVDSQSTAHCFFAVVFPLDERIAGNIVRVGNFRPYRWKIGRARLARTDIVGVIFEHRHFVGFRRNDRLHANNR